MNHGKQVVQRTRKAPSAALRATGINISMNQSVIGNKSYDFNKEGLAHVGMLPDMIADFEVMGVKPQELDPLFNSAEGYIRLWERAEVNGKP